MSCPKCEPRGSRRIYWVLGVIAVVVGLGAVAEHFRPNKPTQLSVSPQTPPSASQDPQAQAFEAALSLSFPVEAPPTTATRAFELRAAPASAEAAMMAELEVAQQKPLD